MTIKLLRKFAFLAVMLVSAVLLLPTENVQAKYPCDWLCKILRDECIEECTYQTHECVLQCQADYNECYEASCP